MRVCVWQVCVVRFPCADLATLRPSPFSRNATTDPLHFLPAAMLGPCQGQGPVPLRALWLAGYPHGSRRRSLPNSSSQSRVHCLLPQVPWLHQRLEEHGLAAQLGVTKHGRAIVECKALVLVEQGMCLSTLAARNLEVEVLWRYLGRPLDLFTFRVRECWLLSEPAQVHTRRRAAGKLGGHSVGLGDGARVTLGWQGVIWNTDDLCHALVARRGQGSQVRVQDVLQDCGLPEDAFGNIPTLLVVQPVLSLVEIGAWSELPCLVRWGLQLWSHWPPRDWECQVRGADWELPAGHQLGLAELSSLASDLRRWAPAIAGSANTLFPQTCCQLCFY